MSTLRACTPDDLPVIASWLRSQDDCRSWAGTRVSFPIDLDLLPRAIQLAESHSFTLEEDGLPVAFGQLVPKPGGRLHLARLITSPAVRGQGRGRQLASWLVAEAISRGANRISLNVIPENSVAIGLYRSLGFQPSVRPPDEPESGSLYMECIV